MLYDSRLVYDISGRGGNTVRGQMFVAVHPGNSLIIFKIIMPPSYKEKDLDTNSVLHTQTKIGINAQFAMT